MKVRNDLRGDYILSLSKPETTTYGLNSFSYLSAKQWDALADFFFLQILRPKYRMLPSCRFFLPDILKLQIVNCKYYILCAYYYYHYFIIITYNAFNVYIYFYIIFM